MLYSIAAQVFSISSPAPGGTFVPFLTEKNTLCQEISLYTTKGGTDTCYGVQSVSPAAHILRSSVLPGEMAFANMDWSKVTIYAEHLDASSTTLLAAVYSRLCFFQTILLHGAFVDYGERGLVFTGPSGIGKTTQAQLWVREKGARIINGDRALLLPGAHGWTAWGWPVCGSSMDCMAQSRPLGHIVFLDQGDSSRIQTLSMAAAVKRLAAQTTINSWNPAFIGRAWDLLEDLAGQIPICRLICTPDETAVETLEKWKRETENFGILP